MSPVANRLVSKAVGFTLMEVLLVLAIIVAVLAMAAPAFTGAMENQRLRTAADMIRTQWTRAHVKAMKTGHIQVFRYQLGGTTFQLEPWAAGDETLEAAPSNGFATTQQLAAPPPEATEGVMAENELPAGITFLSGDAMAEGRSMAIEASLEGIQSSDVQWSRPVMFYPDGATSDAFLIVGNEKEIGIRVDLRGLTGAVHVSDIGSLPDLQY
jgi:type II secretory pathway pseudopilin PulG